MVGRRRCRGVSGGRLRGQPSRSGPSHLHEPDEPFHTRAGTSIDEVDLFVYHQANSRILKEVGQRLGLSPDRIVDVVSSFANTSAASLPIALAAAEREGRLLPGHRVLLAAFGAGLVWGGTVVTWGWPAA